MANNIAFSLPIISFSVRAYKVVPKCLVMNTNNFSISEYTDFGFNSMTFFNNANVVASENGIYEIDDSDLDMETYKIKAHAKTGIVDTYKGVITRMRDAYILYRSDADIKVSVFADKKANRHYYLLVSESQGETIKKRRIKFERGIKNRHFDFRMANVDGGAIVIEKLTVALEPILSKRR